eukprot:TRINITY_DN56980_c0_g1_i1.p1 TRINITY_DN56980_c0_g1~~TRINITY_DN56980_c0_g1_i1.p1  ORF type:complete len:191 (+),score=34.18 TRINITY_DN56980_c0_g1_i1:69-641(+)
MLQANKGAVISSFHKTSLDIRNQELNFFVGVFSTMSSTSGMLAGFASSALTLEIPTWENDELVVAFLVFAACAFGMNLLVVLIATLAGVWAPGRALRGQGTEDLTVAIEVLERHQQSAMRFFILGLFSYFISAIMITWLLFDHVGAIIVTSMLILFLFMVVRQSLVIRRAFLTYQDNTSSHIRGNPMRQY